MVACFWLVVGDIARLQILVGMVAGFCAGGFMPFRYVPHSVLFQNMEPTLVLLFIA